MSTEEQDDEISDRGTMNSPTTTPRTDAVKEQYLTGKTGVYGVLDEARQLEPELARLRAEVERLNGCCEELHTIIDNNGYPSGVDYAKMQARAERAEAEVEQTKDYAFWKDTAKTRAENLERASEQMLVYEQTIARLRAAIDAAMKEARK